MAKERIVVSVSEYEIPLGNLPGIPSRYKYNFIAPAIKQLKEFKSEYPNDKITWLISSLGYSPQDINNLKDTAKKLNVKVLFFDDISQLIYYINADRTFYKISSLVVFSHGIINSVEFRYRPSYLGGSIDPLTLGINDISKLNSSSFNNDIFTHFYSCNTATEKDGTSFAKEWFKNKLGSVKAAVNKTSYDGILGKTNEQINSYLEDSKEKGYSENGSIYYPELGKDAYWVDFI